MAEKIRSTKDEKPIGSVNYGTDKIELKEPEIQQIEYNFEEEKGKLKPATWTGGDKNDERSVESIARLISKKVVPKKKPDIIRRKKIEAAKEKPEKKLIPSSYEAALPKINEILEKSEETIAEPERAGVRFVPFPPDELPVVPERPTVKAEKIVSTEPELPKEYAWIKPARNLKILKGADLTPEKKAEDEDILKERTENAQVNYDFYLQSLADLISKQKTETNPENIKRYDDAIDEIKQAMGDLLRERGNPDLMNKEISEILADDIKEIKEGLTEKTKEQEEERAKKEQMEKAELARLANIIFSPETSKLWKRFVTHGIQALDLEGKLSLINETDLDGKGCRYLMQAAGFNMDNLEYAKQDDTTKNGFYFDMGEEDGVVLKDGGRRVFIDHHSKKSGKNSSTAKFTYRLLEAGHKLKGEKYLDTLVNFITEVDNKSYILNERTFRSSPRTVFGLQRNIDFPKLIEIFKAGIKPGQELTREELKKFGLEEASKKKEITVNKSVEQINEMEKGGFLVDSERFGKIAVDVRRHVPDGFDAVRAFGCQTYLIWGDKTQSFFVTSSKERLDGEKFGQGFGVRGYMWIKPRNDEPLKVRLEDVLEILTDDKFKPTGDLKKYLETGKLKEDIKREKKEVSWKKISEEYGPQLEKVEEIVSDFYKTAFENGPWGDMPEKEKRTKLRASLQRILAKHAASFLSNEGEIDLVVDLLSKKIEKQFKPKKI